MRTSLGWTAGRIRDGWRRESEPHFGRRIVLNVPALLLLLTFSSILAADSKPQQKSKLPRPSQLDQAISWQRDSATGEIRAVRPSGAGAQNEPASPDASSIRVETQMVPLTCSVY